MHMSFWHWPSEFLSANSRIILKNVYFQNAYAVITVKSCCSDNQEARLDSISLRSYSVECNIILSSTFITSVPVISIRS